MGFRVVYLGNDAWSVPPMIAVATTPELDLALVMTRTPRPGRRGAGPSPTPVAVTAREMGLRTAEVETVRGGDGLRRLREAEPDVLAVVAYGEILTPAVLELPRTGAVNLHFSLLPRWRGASPVQHALLAGDRETGVTTMLLDEGLDTGPILARQATSVEADDDAGRLGQRLSEIGGALLARTLTDLATGRATPSPQDDAAATRAPKLTAADRRIDWHEAAYAVLARVRAFAPQPGASTTRAGRMLKILAASETAGDGDPGRVIEVGDRWFDVAANPGAVRVLEVASESRSRMDAGSWLRGARLEIGERLG
ncbi:MAG: methionyl-tRNA formyltransferase [Actinomycetota bacterium]|nr:methionyl-tRNA formyltransferase [Actinomycetota bacterium]